MEQAYADGHDHGRAVATWIEIASADDARAILEDRIFDRYEPGAPLSGEWADGPTIGELEERYAVHGDELDEACDAYEEGFSAAYYGALEEAAAAFLEVSR